jgi:PAS domain-containing protein
MSNSNICLEKLTPVDHRLIELAGQDYSDLVMAQQLSMSRNAIEKRWAKLRKLFGVHSRTAVLAQYYRDSMSRIETTLETQLQLHDQIPIALFGFDFRRRIVYCNRAGAVLTGQDPFELLGDESIWRTSTPGARDRKRIRREFLQSLRDYADHQSEIARKDGTKLLVKWSSLAHSVPIYPFHWWVMGQPVVG